jgi:hypothetical protein
LEERQSEESPHNLSHVDLERLSLIEQASLNYKSKMNLKSNPNQRNLIVRNVLDELLLSNFVCKGHIACQILIGSLFLSEYKRIDLAEIWLRRACNEKFSSRSNPLYENHRAEARRKLAFVMSSQDRNHEANIAIEDAINAYDSHPSLDSLRTGLFDVISNE